ncbi:glycosyl transferase family 90-domain-containing protein [Phakopsora pachyrhizi]|uniref:Glycosyl transferase family 90-domain-containing protein n=1 Tax=Phakopsora pachyrhizi TaxID=170000 RepID=A0AAV0AXW5_PHAPC|nr:glycosyl transferase family 90-domain-containing protein [Phakopsora pachyrhizi]CAH7674288.1 glycosyl transferase family 90-domain-containing protein [Phakopsora pachyrhizi]
MALASIRRIGYLLLLLLVLSFLTLLSLVDRDLSNLSNQSVLRFNPNLNQSDRQIRQPDTSLRTLQPSNHLSQDGHLYLNHQLYLGSTPGSINHPIFDLIRNASESWKTRLSNQSKDLRSAVREYSRRNGRVPPVGFEDWWNWSRDHGVKLLDEHDSMHSDLEAFYALKPQKFRERASDLLGGRTKWKSLIFTLSIRSGQIQLRGLKKSSGPRPKEMVELLRGISQFLPDVDLPISQEDIPVISVSSETRELHLRAARRSQFLSDSEAEGVQPQPGFKGWSSTCSADSRFRQRIDGLETSPLSSYTQSFIHDHTASMQICSHPELNPLNGFLSSANPRVYPFYPLFSFSKYFGFSDLGIVPTSHYSSGSEDESDWNNKQSRLNWRGSNTGILFDSTTNWRQSQRTRLVKFTNVGRGNVKVKRTTSKGGLDFFEADSKLLNDKYFDVGFSGSSSQCDKVDGTCEAIRNIYTFKELQTSNQTSSYKYVIDVDGNGWSGRFHKLMSTKSAILKSTIFPEWYFDRIQPWVHYIPVRVDYQDLYDIMAFFVGDLDGKNGHDQLGEQIGKAGSDWAKEYWRVEDMQSYMYLLILEYSRLMNRTAENPESMDYVPL